MIFLVEKVHFNGDGRGSYKALGFDETPLVVTGNSLTEILENLNLKPFDDCADSCGCRPVVYFNKDLVVNWKSRGEKPNHCLGFQFREALCLNSTNIKDIR